MIRFTLITYSDSDKVTYEDFSRWLDINSNAESLGLSRWLLFPNPNLSLVNKTDTPTFYQTLAGVTHLEEMEVVELEKRFWEIANHSASGQVWIFSTKLTDSYDSDCESLNGFETKVWSYANEKKPH